MANKVSLLGTVRTMEVGDTLSFPADRIWYIKMLASNVGAELDRKFRTHFDKVEKTITISRIA